MPKDLSEWIEEDSLEWYVSDTIDYLDSEGRLEPFYPEPRKDGRGVISATSECSGGTSRSKRQQS